MFGRNNKWFKKEKIKNRIKIRDIVIIKENKQERIEKMKNIKEILIGLIAGITSGLFASGGGLILVPALIYLLKIEDKLARATTVCCILPMVIASSIFYYKDNYINWEIGLQTAIGRYNRRNYRS